MAETSTPTTDKSDKAEEQKPIAAVLEDIRKKRELEAEIEKRKKELIKLEEEIKDRWEKVYLETAKNDLAAILVRNSSLADQLELIDKV